MRKGRPKLRSIKGDPKYNDTLVTKFVNNLMLDGKKDVAFNVFYDALDLVKKRNSEEPELDTWKTALKNCVPQVEVKSRRIGGATFQIPTEINDRRKMSMGMKWMIMFARKRGGKSMADKLANEILAAYKGEGGAVKKKEDTHRMAEANKAFAHFRR